MLLDSVGYTMKEDHLIFPENAHVIALDYQDSFRQMSCYSCRSDALLILKDALRHKNVNQSYFKRGATNRSF